MPETDIQQASAYRDSIDWDGWNPDEAGEAGFLAGLTTLQADHDRYKAALEGWVDDRLMQMWKREAFTDEEWQQKRIETCPALAPPQKGSA